MAPSAGGKTTVLSHLADAFGVSLSTCAKCDGAIFRDFHDQYRLICENGVANHGLWYNAWPAAKSVVQRAKKEVLRLAMARKQELVVSETGAELENLTSLVAELQKNGYKVSLLGIFADPRSIMERGIAREIIDGKLYNRSLKKLKATFQNFGKAIALVDGSFKIVHPGIRKQGLRMWKISIGLGPWGMEVYDGQ
ncbi:unnamed protein product [Cladocopium goreaui]|uniref:EF-hand domain-containing protein n=1 Tax=Cladocopium goreaui TaxID=2562237 RepID=A0A9P1CL68_9DINO|nr:unnamed protein product [Cladocopium goreaui]